MSRKFEDLVALQARLRAPGGCPWDREQTHETLRTYLLEEAYEVLDALESGDAEKFAAELGDLLLQIVFHAQIAREEGRFEIGDVVNHIHTKLVRRHPHVFGDAAAGTAAEVVKNWERLKAEEREADGEAGGGSLLEGIPRSLPAVLQAYQMTRRAARVGLDWDDLEGLLEKLGEEAGELRRAREVADPAARRARVEEEAGDLLFVAVNVARFLHVDPELGLEKANRKFRARVQWMEAEQQRRGGQLADVSRDDLERLWEASKQATRTPAEGEGR